MSKSFFSLKGKQWNNLGAYSYFAVGGHIYTRNESKYLCWGSWKTRLVLLPVCMKNDNLILFGVLWRNRVPYLPLVIKIATILMFFCLFFTLQQTISGKKGSDQCNTNHYPICYKTECSRIFWSWNLLIDPAHISCRSEYVIHIWNNLLEPWERKTICNQYWQKDKVYSAQPMQENMVVYLF